MYRDNRFSVNPNGLNRTIYYILSFKGCFIIANLQFAHSLTGYLQCIDSATVSIVQKYSLQIQTLSYSQAIIPLTANQSVPEGCAVAIASDRCTVNLMLKVSVSNLLNLVWFLPSLM